MCGLIFQGNHFLWDGRITVHMVRNPSICFLLCHWSIPADRDWSIPRALAHNPWPISQWGVKTLHNLNMHINSLRVCEYHRINGGPRTPDAARVESLHISSCSPLLWKRLKENTFFCQTLFILSFHLSISNIQYVSTGLCWQLGCGYLVSRR